ncbi:MAG TPA: dTMP kinase [Alphaproteobacteria bacterium]|jgi:dTMP kinase|nr:dTMP kinase [Alphaproteobacteria bacterium]|tara:strand:- start:1033 stop:1677 length:645 start_codon:yes stop_codon:yes gene_type:complete
MSGYFITFEGGEGSGKSTQIQLLVDHLSRALSGVAPVVTREPGGTDSAESIRQLLVTGKAERWRAATEAMLMSASRHEHVAHVLRPALAAGKLVICDRYNDSTRAYQGLVGGVPREDIEALNRLACGDLVPDLTILLDMDVAEGLRRASDRAGDESRFESKGLEFHQKVRTAFLDLAGRYPDRFVIVDAGRSVETVAADIVDIVMPRLATARLG